MLTNKFTDYTTFVAVDLKIVFTNSQKKKKTLTIFCKIQKKDCSQRPKLASIDQLIFIAFRR